MVTEFVFHDLGLLDYIGDVTNQTEQYSQRNIAPNTLDIFLSCTTSRLYCVILPRQNALIVGHTFIVQDDGATVGTLSGNLPREVDLGIR